MMADHELVFCKLGGSVLTNKARPETARPDVIACLAGEVARSLATRPGLQLVLGHGSGSFGHVAAHSYSTHLGVRNAAEWMGFARVAAAAARLNRIVTEALLSAGVPAWSVQPSASAWCQDGELLSLEAGLVEEALRRGLVPLLYGDVAFDRLRGGTIISTEVVLSYLARRLHPTRLIHLTAEDGVYEGDPHRDPEARLIPVISASNWPQVHTALGGSHATDVTGGMLSKVEQAVELVRELPELCVHIISGEHPGALEAVLTHPEAPAGGTVICWEARPHR